MLKRLGSLVLTCVFVGVAISQSAASPASPDLTIEAVSAPANWVSRDRVLLHLKGRPAARLVLTVNGRNEAEIISPQDLMYLVKGLKPGVNRIELTQGKTKAALDVRNFGDGPIFSGKRTEPFICQTDAFKLPNGKTLGKPGAISDTQIVPDLAAACWARLDIQYVYKPKGQNRLVPLPVPEVIPSDADQTTTLEGVAAPFVVRVETGVMNRGVYQFAVLANPAAERELRYDFPPKAWNRRLLAVHGTGCARGWYIQGAAMGVSPLGDLQRLGEGFAVFTSTLNHPTNSCNAILAAEMTLMVRQKVIETLGPPLYTLSMGGSGGAYTSLQIADAFPGLIDGVLTSATFPDALAIATQGLDGHLLTHYFATHEGFTPQQVQAVGGYGSPSGLRGNGNQAGRTDPISGRPDVQGYQAGVWNDAVPKALRYDPRTNPKGARATVFDVAANVYGRDPATGFGRRPFDNVGVQYGLGALNDGVITPAQFIDLNAHVGGYDNDANYVAGRTTGDPVAIRNAYAGGLMLSGAGGLKSIPVLDYSGIYSDLGDQGDYHMKHHHFEVRGRMDRWGSGGNLVMWSGPNRAGRGNDGGPEAAGSAADGAAAAKMSAEAFVQINAWLTNIAQDRASGAAAQRVARNRPKTLEDGCWKGEAAGPRFIAERQVGTGKTVCNDLYPPHMQPRMVAGAPAAGDILKCTLKPLRRGDYKARFTDAEWKALAQAFPSGVCDWSKLGQGQQPVRPWSTW